MRIFNVQISAETMKITWRAIWRSCLIGTFLAGLTCTRYQRFAGRGIDDDRELTIVIVIMSMVAAYWTLIGFEAFKDAFNKRQALAAAISTKNKKKFMDNVDRQIPYPMELLIGVTAAIFFTAFLTIDLSNVRVGTVLGFFIGFFFTFVREVAVIADNPLEGLWRLKFTPGTKRWREQALATVKGKTFLEILLSRQGDEDEKDEESEEDLLES